MHPNLIALAVPVFVAAILAEVMADERGRRGLYRFGTAIADLDVGIASRVFEVLLEGVGVLAYMAVYRHRLLSFAEGSPWPWVVSLIGIDFLYYWWHRLSHVVNVLWAVHAVHHQSEDFNFAVALRQPALSPITILPFHLPLALLGIEPWIYVSSYAINLIYQFWIHTELPGRMGPIEWVLNTPSAHRVHHAINPQYLDRNYGGILIVWDRLFRTYQREEEAPVYGVTHPLRSYNPLWANLAPFADLAALMRTLPTGPSKVRALLAHPAQLPIAGAMHSTRVTRTALSRYAPRQPRRIVVYVTIHFILLSLAAGAFMSVAAGAPAGELAAPGLLVLASAAALGGWTERKRWALALDLLRQVAAIAWLAIFLWARLGASASALATVALAVLFLAAFATTRPDSIDRPATI